MIMICSALGRGEVLSLSMRENSYVISSGFLLARKKKTAIGSQWDRHPEAGIWGGKACKGVNDPM